MNADTADPEATTPGTAGPPTDRLLALAWRYHRQWSLAADAAKKRLDGWRKRNLALLIAGALAGALATQTWPGQTGSRVLAIVAALALALAGYIQANALKPDQTARWRRARVASEALKAEVFRFLVGVAPYAGPDRGAVLQAQLAVIQDRAGTQLVDQLAVQPDDRPLPTLRTVAEYVTDRARHQADWHRKQTRVHARQGRNLRIRQLAVTVVGAVLSALSAAVPDWHLSTWTAAATTVAAAIGAQLAATRHLRIAEAYAVTTDQLDRLIAGFDPASATPAQQALFVTAVERVLADQNNGWTDLLSSAPPSGEAEPPAGTGDKPMAE